MELAEFDYNLPKELIAQYPSQKRDESRLLVLHRDTGDIEHRIFKDIVEYVHKDDLLVLNNTRVVPVRLVGKKETGGKVEALVLLSGEGCRVKDGDLGEGCRVKGGNEYEVLLKPARGCNAGSRLIFGDGQLKAIVSKIQNNRRFLKFECNGDLEGLLNRFGQMPLPPYIKRNVIETDRERYQTVYADKKGAVAAPTAGLHFTKDILSNIRDKGIDVEYVTLHVGYGTFKPVRSLNIKSHRMEKEYYEVKKEVISNIRNKNGRVIAVGTTTTRVLETVLPESNVYRGWTDLFIYPPYKFKIVDVVLTNFHLPRTTLFMLVSAFCGKGMLLKAYQEAIEKRYRFYSYGDAMLII